MAIDSVGSLTAVIRSLRQRLGAQSRRPDNAGKTNTASQDIRPSGKDIGELQRRLVAGLAQLNPGERESDAAVKVFVDAVIGWEFGEEMLSDPGVDQLSSKVQSLLNESSTTRRSLGRVLDEMSRAP